MDIHWRSFELRPKNAPPPPPDYLERVKAGRPRLYEMARTQYGLELNPGPFGFDSRPALVGAKFAEEEGAGPAYHAAVMRGYWLEARDISQVDVLREIATEAGLDADAFSAALAEEKYVAAVDTDVEQAHLYGINGVPAMVFINKYLVSGAQPYEVLCGAVEQIQGELSQPSEDAD